MSKPLIWHMLLVILLALLAQLGVTITLTLMQKTEMTEDIVQHVTTAAKRQASRLAKSAWLLCDMDYKRTRTVLTSTRDGARKDLADAGGLQSTGTHTLSVRHISSPETITVTIPKLSIGGQEILLNSDPTVTTPFVDRIARHSRADITIWQRMNREGDMLRLGTSWTTTEGKRAVGVYQRKSDPGWGKIIENILAGREHFSYIMAIDTKFAALFVPLYVTGETEVAGMIGIGINLDNILADITAAIASLELDNNGYVGILHAGRLEGTEVQGRSTRGMIVLGDERFARGTNLWDYMVDDEYPAREVIRTGLEAYDNKDADSTRFHDRTGIVSYKWLPPTGAEVKGTGVKWKTKIAAVTYFEPFDWCIYASIYEDDFGDISKEIYDNLHSMMVISIAGSLLAVLFAGIIARSILGRVVQPIKQVVAAVEQIAQGDLASANSRIGDHENKHSVLEADMLWSAVEKMIGSLLSLVSQAQKSSVALVSSANQIRATSRSQETTMQEFEGHVAHVAAAIREISATSQELVRTMVDLKGNAAEAARLAVDGKQGLSGMEKMLDRLARQTLEIAAKLAHINEKTNNIGMVVTTITKVAEQTNLLSLNAAIEAEKAGEYGLGFSVVAQEIRRLADQTAVATLDIERIVKEMQSSVTAGVMEMDRFAEDVRASVSSGETISQQLTEVINKVEELNPRFEKVSESMQMQSQGARQISDSMVQLNDAARNLADSFRNFNEAADSLRNSADAMKEEVARFKVN